MHLLKHLTSLLCAFLLFAGASGAAKAEYVTVSFTAKVRKVVDDVGILNGKIKIGDYIDGVYTYDRTTLPLDAGRTWAGYEWQSGASGVTIKTEAGLFRTKPGSFDVEMWVANDQTIGLGKDTLNIYSYRNDFSISVPNAFREIVYVKFADESGTTLNSIALPFGHIFNLLHWDNATVEIQSRGVGGKEMTVEADIISLDEIL